MALNHILLANEIKTALIMPFITPELLGFCDGLVTEIKSEAQATFAFIAGPHIVSGLDGEHLANTLIPKMGFSGILASLELGTPEMMIKICTGMVTHIMSGIVTYGGEEPIPPITPPLAWSIDGKISGLVGVAMANEIKNLVGPTFTSPKYITFCTAICNHIMINAEINYGVFS